jgi:hypothetical protein
MGNFLLTVSEVSFLLQRPALPAFHMAPASDVHGDACNDDTGQGDNQMLNGKRAPYQADNQDCPGDGLPGVRGAGLLMLIPPSQLCFLALLSHNSDVDNSIVQRFQCIRVSRLPRFPDYPYAGMRLEKSF